MSEKRYELRKQVKNVRWMIFWVVLAQFAAEVAVEAAVSFMAKPPHEYVRIALIELLAIGIPIVLYARTVWSGGRVKAEFCLNRCGLFYICLAAVLGIAGQFVMMLLNVPANYLMSLISGVRTESGISVAESREEIALGVLGVVIIPAVVEEFLMRGIIFRAYNKCSTYAAVAFTAIVFALLHLRVNEIAGFLLMSVTAAVLLIKSNSLYAAMIYHAFSNMTALLFSAFIMPRIYGFLWLSFAVMTVIFAAGFVILLKQKGRMRINRSFGAFSLTANGLFSMPVLLSVGLVILKYFLLNLAG